MVMQGALRRAADSEENGTRRVGEPDVFDELGCVVLARELIRRLGDPVFLRPYCGFGGGGGDVD